MTETDILTLGAAEVDSATGVPQAQATRDLGSDDERDFEDFGTVPMMPCLGVTSLPAPADDTGHAEGVIMRNVGGLDGVCVGGWDTRTASVAGQLSPGDTCLHGTGPKHRSRVMCKKGLIALVVGDPEGDSDAGKVVFVLDGSDKTVKLVGNGAIIQMGADGSIDLAGPANNGIRITADGTVAIYGATVTLGGLNTPPLPGVTTALAGPAGIAGVPVPNVHLLPA